MYKFTSVSKCVPQMVDIRVCIGLSYELCGKWLHSVAKGGNVCLLS